MKNLSKVFLLIFLLGAFVRFADVWRPIDGASWRECDEGAVARNFVREGMNPFYPRVDWRGTSEGFAEMEFPAFPYLTAISYELFGFHEWQARLINFLFSLGALFFFLQLARSYLDDLSALAAFAFFAFHPLAIESSTAIQPEGLMILCYAGSVYFFTHWIKNDSTKDFICVLVFTALAILAKASAAHVGLLFAVLLVQKYGFTGVFKQTKVWIFGLFSLIPAILWYSHAKHLWLAYGNSLGVSNEYHWVGLDFFTNPYFIKGILFTEIFHVWLMFGVIVGIFAVWKGWNENVIRFALLWFVAIFAFYFVTARTSADDWAYYYHVFSVLPAALLFGFGAGKIFEMWTDFRESYREKFDIPKAVLIFLLAFAVGMTFLLEAKRIRAMILEHRVKDESFACSKVFAPAMPKPGLILASGGNCFDPDGFPVAYNASFMFYWLDRKGFNVCNEQQSIEKVREFAAKGAKYFVAQKRNLTEKSNLETQLRENFTVAAECDAMILFDIESADKSNK